jgi:hypothetical protein
MEIRADLIPLSDLAVQNSRTSLRVVLGAVTAVLLIVCLNLATLMLARDTEKSGDGVGNSARREPLATDSSGTVGMLGSLRDRGYSWHLTGKGGILGDSGRSASNPT